MVRRLAGAIAAGSMFLGASALADTPANDYPTALAPYWGFCTADDPIWQATIDFAFSAKNARGYAPGLLGALGSSHTPGGWPLGNVQEYIVARIQGEQAHADAIMQRQVAVSQCDSALPETYDPESGQAYARYWFSWPEASTFHYLRLFEGQRRKNGVTS